MVEQDKKILNIMKKKRSINEDESLQFSLVNDKIIFCNKIRNTSVEIFLNIQCKNR